MPATMEDTLIGSRVRFRPMLDSKIIDRSSLIEFIE